MLDKHITLPDMEREVIMILAEQGPKSGYDFHLGGKRQRREKKAIMSSGYWITVLKDLGPEGLALICRVESSRLHSADERGRRKDLYWLTDKGVFLALSYNTSSKWLLKHVKEIYPEHRLLQLVIELREALGDRAYDYAFSESTNLDNPSEIPLKSYVTRAVMYGILKARELSPENDPRALMDKLYAILKRYPEILELRNKIVKMMKPEMDLFFQEWKNGSVKS